MATQTDVLSRTVDWVLDHDGDIYGDEQERLRWYEAIAVVASIQWILIPWLGVLCLAAWGRGAAPSVAVLLVVGLILPMTVANAYVTRRRVRVAPERWSRKRIGVTVVSLLPVVILLGQYAWIYDRSGATSVGALLGAAVGGVGSLAFKLARDRRSQAARSAQDDEAE